MAYTTPKPVMLYSSPISDCSARLRIGLNLKNVPYQLIDVNLKTQQNNDSNYSKVNASRTVPTLVHGDVVIIQSPAALEYLDEMFPHIDPLLPQDLAARAKARTLMNIIAADTHPLLTHRVGRTIEDMFPGGDVHVWRVEWLRRGLEKFEAEVAKTAGAYCVGDAITIADVCLVPAWWTAERWGFRLTDYPTIAKIYNNLDAVEAFKAARQNPGSELDD